MGLSEEERRRIEQDEYRAAVRKQLERTVSTQGSGGDSNIYRAAGAAAGHAARGVFRPILLLAVAVLVTAGAIVLFLWIAGDL